MPKSARSGCNRTDLGVVFGGLVLLLHLWPQLGAAQPIRPPSSPRPPIDVVLPCGAPGQACCRWPGAPPDAVNPVHCNSGAGCDITTSTCVAPCGAGGQVCCDGPDTRAIQWKPDGKMLQPSGPLARDMCDAGICLDSRRCDVSCGRTAGAPCCPPDVAIGSATCKANSLTCANDPGTFKTGTCVACGNQGQPPCDFTGCEAPAGSTRTTERNNVCVACGVPGLPKCSEHKRKCGAGAAPDPLRDRCVIGGGKDEPCLEGGFCGFDGMFCDASNKCRLCGQPGQRCCPDQELLGGGRLLECGGFSNVVCEGSPGQRFCHLTPPLDSGAPPANPPLTCSGQPFGIGITMPFEIWVRDANGCASRVAVLFANSPAEALGCARASNGNVIDDLVQEFRVAASGPRGCNGYTIVAKDDEDAKACAQALCGIDCGEAELGECP